MESGAWRRFKRSYDGRTISFGEEEFPKFCQQELGVRPARLYEAARMFPSEQARLEAMIEELAGRPQHLHSQSDTNNVSVTHGNKSSYGYRRLKKEGRTDLLQRIDAGEMSVNAATIEAGLRRPTATIYIDSPRAAVKGLLNRFSADEIMEALREEM